MTSKETIETCRDGHHCFNGSKCVQNPYQDFAYFCDCEEVVFEARYEGLYCEHKAEVYCIAEGASKHSFCTNGGTCREFVGPDEAHVDCDCPSQFEGSYCQFVKGTKPKNWPYNTKDASSTSLNKNSSGAAVAVMVILFSFIVIIAYRFKRYYGVETINERIERELEMTCDEKPLRGNGLKEGIEQSMRESSESSKETNQIV